MKHQTRLRVMEHLFELSTYDLCTNLDVPVDEIKAWLNQFHPNWIAGPQETPTPDTVVNSIRALCQHYSTIMVETLGYPKDYEDHLALEHAVVKLYEVES